MSTAIFRAPEGLLPFLATKAVGRNPDALEQVVRPTLDLWPFYQKNFDLKRQSVTSATFTALGVLATSITVPAGKLWMPMGHTVICAGIGANDTCRVRPAILDAQDNLLWVAENGSQFAANFTTSSAAQCTPYWRHPMLFGPGIQFAGYVEQIVNSTTGSQATIVVAYHELDN